MNHTAHGTPYVDVTGTVKGDPVRARVPARAPLTVPIVYCVHSYGTDHNAIDTMFSWVGGLLLDAGYAIAVPRLGGSLWSSPTAQTLLKAHDTAAVEYATTRRRKVGARFILGTSHGGALAAWAVGKTLLPNLRGAYLLNGVFDLEADTRQLLASLPAFGYSRSAVRASNPARLPATAWKGKRVRVSYDPADTTVPPALHGQRLERHGATAARHTAGHDAPASFAPDVVKTFNAWL